MKRYFVTSFSPEGYKSYGKTFLEGFLTYFPKQEVLHVFYEGEKPAFVNPRIFFHDLLEDKNLTDFLERNQHIDVRNGIFQQDNKFILNYRYMATKFARKVFALTSPMLPDADWRVWIDADVVVKKEIPEDFFDMNFMDPSVFAYYLGREVSWDHSECGFVAYQTKQQEVKEFLSAFRSVYVTDRVFSQFAEWHDSHVFDVLRKDMTVALGEIGNPLRFHNISEGIDLQHPWPETVLGQYLSHLKGPTRKEMPPVEADLLQQTPQKLNVHKELLKKEDEQQLTQQNPPGVDLIQLLVGCKNRYEQLPRIVGVFKPQSILEVGVCHLDVAQEGLKHKSNLYYTTVGNFENVEEVKKALEGLKQTYPEFVFKVTQGNPVDVLVDVTKERDFAFIGGSVVAADIQKVYTNLKDKCKMVILDHFCLEGNETAEFGSNTVVSTVPNAILPVQDVYEGGNKVALVMTGVPLGDQQGPIKLQTRNSAPDHEIQAHIAYAAQYQEHKVEEKKKWLNRIKPINFLKTACKPHDETVVFIGAGQSVKMKDHPEYNTLWAEIKEHAADPNTKIVVAKTSHKLMKEHNISPFGMMVLDPRDHVAGFLKPEEDPEMVYFVSTMCHPTTFDKLLDGNARILGYHALVGAGEVPVVAKEFGDALIVAGGTTSITRGIHLFYMLGFRKMVVYGLEGSYWRKPEKPHGRSPKPFVEVEVGGRKFLTDPEFIAESQDFEHIVKMHPDIDLTVRGDGMILHAFNIISEKSKETPGDPIFIDGRVGQWTHAFKAKNSVLESIHIDRAIKALQDRKTSLQSVYDGLEDYHINIPV